MKPNFLRKKEGKKLPLATFKFMLLLFLIFLVSRPLLWAGSALQFPAISTTRVVFPNGLRLLIRERPETQNAAIYLLVGAGQVTEEEEKAGITHLLQNYLLEIPVKTYHDAATALEAQGGVLSASTNADFSSIYADIPLSRLSLAFEVLSELFPLKKVDPEIFHQIKEDTLQSIQHSRDQTYQALYSLFLQEFYIFHPYRVPIYGLTNTVKSITPLDLLSYAQRYYVPNNLVIAVVGNVDTEQVIRLVKKYFSGLPEKPIPPHSVYYQPLLDDNKEINLQGNGNVAWLFLGFSAPGVRSRDYPSMGLVNSVLGASIGSRIWLSIREKRGLSYELGSQYESREGPSHFLIYVTTSLENLEESKRSLLQQMERIRKEPLTSAELEIFKRTMTGHFILRLETNHAQAEFLSWSEFFGKGVLYAQEYLKEIQRINPGEVQDLAKKYLTYYILLSVK